MKEALLLGLATGMVLGIVAGALCKPVQNVVNSGKEEFQKTIEKLK